MRSAYNGLLVFILNDLVGVRESFKNVKNQMEMAPKSFAIIGSVLAKTPQSWHQWPGMLPRF